jgi:hypothetical protein
MMAPVNSWLRQFGHALSLKPIGKGARPFNVRLSFGSLSTLHLDCQSTSFAWPLPVRPGDELRVESDILNVRASKSRPEQGLLKVKTTTLNENNEAVQVVIANLLVPCRGGG